MSNGRRELLEQRFSADLASKAEQWLRSKSLSRNSVRAYQAELQRLFEWADFAGVSHLHDVDMRVFLQWCRDVFSASNDGALPRLGSLLQTKRIVSAFLRYAALKRDEPESERWRVGSAFVHSLTEAADEIPEVVALGRRLTARSAPILLQPGRPEEESFPNRLLAAISFWTAATAAELAGLRVADVDPDGRVSIGVGSRRRTVRLPAQVQDALQEYIRLAEKRGKAKRRLFTGAGDQDLSEAAVRRRIRSLTTEDDPRPSPRKLRRLFAHLAEFQSIAPGATAYRMGKQQTRSASAGRDLGSAELHSLWEAVRKLPVQQAS